MAIALIKAAVSNGGVLSTSLGATAKDSAMAKAAFTVRGMVRVPKGGTTATHAEERTSASRYATSSSAGMSMLT
jgi:hypothetical protein